MPSPNVVSLPPSVRADFRSALGSSGAVPRVGVALGHEQRPFRPGSRPPRNLHVLERTIRAVNVVNGLEAQGSLTAPGAELSVRRAMRPTGRVLGDQALVWAAGTAVVSPRR